MSLQRYRQEAKLLLISALSAIAAIVVFDFMRWVHYDIPSFIGGARYMFGLEGGFDHQSRLTKPLALVLPAVLEYLSGISVVYGFLVQNALAYLLTPIGVYYMARELPDVSERAAFRAALLYLGCQCSAIFSFVVLSDMPAWCAGAWGLWQAAALSQGKPVTTMRIVWIGGLMGAGLLLKESAIIAPMGLGVFVGLSERYGLRDKFRIILFAALGFVAVLGAAQVLSYHLWADNIFIRAKEMRDVQGFTFYARDNIMQVWRIIDVYWWAALIGGGLMLLHQTRLAVQLGLTCGLALLLLPLAYPFVVDRLLFLVAPLLMVFCAKGLDIYEKIHLRLPECYVLLGAVLNWWAAYMIYRYDSKGVIAIASLIYLGALAAGVVYARFRVRDRSV